jgi:hypothetical protein
MSASEASSALVSQVHLFFSLIPCGLVNDRCLASFAGKVESQVLQGQPIGYCRAILGGETLPSLFISLFNGSP